MRALFLLCVTIAMSAVAGLAMASDGRLEINQSCVATGCFAGDTPGIPIETQPNQSYVLTSNIAAGASAVGVSLGAGSTLDLNGFTIEGDATCAGAPVTSCSQQGFNGGGVIANEGSLVKNGTIRGIRSYGIRAEPFVRVENMRLEQNAAGGVVGNGEATGCVVQDSQIVRNGGAGVGFAQGNGALGARVLRNTVHGNEFTGVQGAVSLLLDNAITNNGGVGAVLNYGGSLAGFGNNQIYGNNGGNANPQMSGGLSIGANICGTNTTCP